MRRVVFFMALLVFVAKLSAQRSFQEVDSVSYAMYTQSKWSELIILQEENKEQEFDFYLLNLRFGFAHFYKKDYTKSIVSFERALHNDSTSQVALEYMFWNYYYLSDFKNADLYYNRLEKPIQDKIVYQPLRKLDFVYVESGLNFNNPKGKQQNLDKSNRKTTPNSLPYMNVGVKGNFSHKFGMYGAYYFQNETLESTDYKLHRVFAKPNYKLTKTREVGVGVSYIYSNNNSAFSQDFNYINTEEEVLIDGYSYQQVTSGEGVEKDTGIAIEKGGNATFYFTQLFQKLKVSPFVGVSKSIVDVNTLYTKEGTENVVYYYEWEEVYNENFAIIAEEERQETSKYFRYSFGVNIGVDLTDRLGVGLELSSDMSTFNYIPSLLYKVSDKFKISLEYIAKDEAPLYYYNGVQFINNNNKMQRFGLLADISLTKAIDLYLVYQHDAVVIESGDLSQSNTAILGVKYQFK